MIDTLTYMTNRSPTWQARRMNDGCRLLNLEMGNRRKIRHKPIYEGVPGWLSGFVRDTKSPWGNARRGGPRAEPAPPPFVMPPITCPKKRKVLSHIRSLEMSRRAREMHRRYRPLHTDMELNVSDISPHQERKWREMSVRELEGLRRRLCEEFLKERRMSEFKVEKGVPRPERSGNVARYPWAEMSDGDSFFVPYEPGRNRHIQSGNLLACGRGWFARRNIPCEIVARKEADGIRVWFFDA